MELKKIYGNKRLITFARENRKSPTKGELILWQNVRNRRFRGYKFRRQAPMHKYIVDFYCHELKLVIEIDGSSHDESRYEYDLRRQMELEEVGLVVLRFSEREAVYEITAVLKAIGDFIENVS